MSQYGDAGMDISSNEAKGLLILSLLSKFANAYSQMISNILQPIVLILNLGGKYLKAATTELFGGARINYIFNDIFKKCINGIDPFDVLTDEVVFSVSIINLNRIS